MATARKPTSRRKADEQSQELLLELTSWASTGKVTNDPYVRALTHALETGEDIESIAEINPLDYLPHPEFTAGARRLKINNILTIIRNVLVFAPVALTWLAVSFATTAFAEYTKANADAVVNFLEFWQDGYGVLDKKWTIGHVGLLDFYLIAVVIVLTLITALMTTRHQQEQKTYVARLDDKRTELGLKLHSYLYTQRKVTPETVNARVAASVKNLQTSSKSMAQASKDLRKDINSIPSNKQVIAEIKKMNKF
jgi:hypothetical protein